MKITRILAAACFALLVAEPALASQLKIQEFTKLGVTFNGVQPEIAPLPPIASQVVDFSGGVASSAVLNTATYYARLRCDVQCAVRVGTSPQTAATTDMTLSAGVAEYFAVPAGAVISVIASP